MKPYVAIDAAAVMGSASIYTGAVTAENYKKLSGDQIRARWDESKLANGSFKNMSSVSIFPNRMVDVSRRDSPGRAFS
jgi:hypothetical protein